MSSTMHIQTKRVVEYADSGLFNYKQDKLHNILMELEVPYTTIDQDVPEYDLSFEVSKDGVRKAVDKLEAIQNVGEAETVDKGILESYLNESGMTCQKLIDLFKWMLVKAEPNSDYIYVDFF